MFFKKISNNENKYFELNSKNKILKTSDLYEENPSFIKINKIGYLNFSQLNDSKINTIVYPTIQSEITGTYIQTNSLQINDSIIFKDQLNLNNFTLNYQGYFSSISLSSVNDLLSINDCYAISPNPITINTVTINNFTSNIDKSQAGIGFTVYKNVSHLGLYYVHADNTYSNEFY
jgi:hypothetical protein